VLAAALATPQRLTGLIGEPSETGCCSDPPKATLLPAIKKRISQFIVLITSKKMSVLIEIDSKAPKG
jgi:hypothetical protein